MVLDKHVFSLHLTAAVLALESAEKYLENYNAHRSPMSKLLLDHSLDTARDKVAMAKLYIKKEEE